MSLQVHVHRDAETAALAAATQFILIGQHAIQRHGRFCVALAGGMTPVRMYEILAEPRRSADQTTPSGEVVQRQSQNILDEGPDAEPAVLDWGRVHFFFTDERCVPQDHPDSNFAMVCRELLDRIRVPVSHVYRMEGERTPFEAAAERYDSQLRTFFGASNHQAPIGPTFDLVLLGIGRDGHTASLFPGSVATSEKHRWAVHTKAPEGVEPRDRITLTLPVINAARNVMFLVSGPKKSQVVRRLISGVGDPSWPAAMIQCAGATQWHLDEAAAGATN